VRSLYPAADGTDRAAYQHRSVRGVNWRLSRNGRLQLPGGILGMELFDPYPSAVSASRTSRT
jgi:hypothetical protein